ncbi:MAG: DUF3604 domain-containing protein [Halieaceae bacterium]|nr:DUF3604 domain-containing protein [Halieaceae bacterium]
MTQRIFLTLSVFAATLTLAGCQDSDPQSFTEPASAVSQPQDSLEIAVSPTKTALFGDLHVHTSQSFDAFVFGVRRSPEDAYRYAQGEAIPQDAGGTIQLAGPPLDFYAVTDHGEYLGVVPAMADPSSPMSKTATAQAAFGDNASASDATFSKIGLSFVTQSPLEDIYDRSFIAGNWRKTADTADQYYRPGEFTTFAAYEFTAMRVVDVDLGGAANLHRNVVFENTSPDDIFTTLMSGDPAELWDWMEQQRAQGNDSLAIPHNSNASNGLMFSATDENGEPLSKELMAQRVRNEPIMEITQIKGTSDTRPMFSPDDEWAEFEHYPYLIGSNMLNQDAEGSYARPSLSKGIQLQQEQGANPFEFGFIGASDTHLAAGTYVESTYWGKFPSEGRDPKLRNSVPPGPAGTEWIDAEISGEQGLLVGASAAAYSASGLAGVWAESNTREAIFAAMKRRETFGTSGPRMQVRFFAGDYQENLLTKVDTLETAYAEGVPMGGRLSEQSEAPKMMVWATQDPLSAPLQRAQVIKVWRDADGNHNERVFDVACSGDAAPNVNYRCPDNGASVDLSSCDIQAGTGQAELKTLWQDPEFDANQSAAYFVRVLENPTCRWSSWDAARAGIKPNPDLPAILQERAWSSAIWVN